MVGVVDFLIQNSRFKIRKSTNDSNVEFEILDFELWTCGVGDRENGRRDSGIRDEGRRVEGTSGRGDEEKTSTIGTFGPVNPELKNQFYQFDQCTINL
jgi:hypothetical protein